MKNPAKIKTYTKYTLLPELAVIMALLALITIFGAGNVWLVIVAVIAALFILRRERVARERR